MPRKTQTPNVDARGDSIRITFRWNKVRHRETLALHPTAPNIKHAVRLQRSIEDAIALNQFTLDDYERHFPHSDWLRRRRHVTRGDHTVDAGLEAWFIDQTPSLKPTTIKAYRSAINEFQSRWAGLHTPELTLPVIKQWIAERQRGGTTLKTIRNRLLPLRGMLDDAVADGTIEVNPLDKLPNLRPSEAERAKRLTDDEIDPFDITELQLILKGAHEPQVVNTIEFGAWTGLRSGELFGLAWEDIDLHHGTARVTRAWTDRKWVSPKTRAGVRLLPLLPQALAVLKRQKALTYMLPPVEAGPFGQIRPVFRNPRSDAPWNYLSFGRGYWIPLLRKAGIRYRYPYQLRHTFASMCLSAGENELWVAKYLGHADTSMVRRNYGKWLAEAAKQSGQGGGSKISQLITATG